MAGLISGWLKLPFFKKASRLVRSGARAFAAAVPLSASMLVKSSIIPIVLDFTSTDLLFREH
ncbi:hypothetical protein WK26_29375 [Burkholderia vietnamiensis]|nr:hypothetical protein WI97_16900 [Burkholderia vietnamiensis]TPQ43256.1 hypothetical protein C2U71_18980 [Burkholderia ubonensis]KVE91532.1 hypothetical protein WJ03_28385 [Burkholderia vietnamiensis]KVG01762.1 hypothetical protein WJ21_07710 [Burkholderia vietnamiensis]KVR89036.1 hypothetical protein WK26_29375 [Burkholderia vietnamiensis]